MLFAHGDMSGVAYAVLTYLGIWGLSIGVLVAGGVAIATKKPWMLLWTPVFAVLVIVLTAIAWWVWSGMP